MCRTTIEIPGIEDFVAEPAEAKPEFEPPFEKTVEAESFPDFAPDHFPDEEIEEIGEEPETIPTPSHPSGDAEVKARKKDVDAITARVIDVTIRLGIVVLLMGWALRIISPFVDPIVWGAILSIALFPLFNQFCAMLGGRRKLAGALCIIGAIATLIVPAFMLVSGSVDTARELSGKWEAGEIHVPPPAEKVKEWPVIGERTFAAWQNMSENLRETLAKFKPQIVQGGRKLVSSMVGAVKDILSFAFSMIIGGILLIHGHSLTGFLRTIGTRIAGESGEQMVKLATATIRGVALGVVGTACIQALLASIGIVLMGIPLAALWTVAVLMMAVCQLPPILILGPLAFYGFSTHELVPASIFAVWCVIVSALDGVLKPVLMGRGSDIPMLVLLVGALGGMMLTGIMGLFVGAVIVALAYRLFGAWMKAGKVSPEVGQIEDLTTGEFAPEPVEAVS